MLVNELESAHATVGARRHSHLLDAYLLAAGMGQIAEDFRHRELRLTELVGRRVPQLGSVAVDAAERALRGICDVRYTSLAQWCQDFSGLLTKLGMLCLRGTVGAGDTAALHEVCSVAEALSPATAALPSRLQAEVLRLPDCFRSFDQRPEDARTLAGLFAQQWSARQIPILVVGVRTSGSYLAPLQAAALRERGYPRVRWLTYRPERGWTRDERRVVAAVGRRGGVVVVVDDPPVTGSKLASSADAIEKLGFARGAVVLFLPLLGSPAAVPDRLAGRQVVTLPWGQWSVQRQLEPGNIARTLDDLLRGRRVFVPSCGNEREIAEVLQATRLPLEPVQDVLARPLVRSHLRAIYRIRAEDVAGNGVDLDVYVKGTGQGYFGRHSAELGRRLGESVPATYGWSDGLLFRQALPERARVHLRSLGPPEATAIAEYISRRARATIVPADTSQRLVRRRAVWTAAGDSLTGGVGSWAPVAAPMLRLAMRSMLTAAQPSVVDGSTAVSQWFMGQQGQLVKTDFDERAFSVWDHACYDAAWDVAGVAANHEVRVARDGNDADFSDLVRRSFERDTQAAVPPERWLLYQLLHLTSARAHLLRLLRQGVGQLQAQDGGPHPTPQVSEDGFVRHLHEDIWCCDAAFRRTYAKYLVDVLLDGVDRAPAGPHCLLDSEALLEGGTNRAGTLTYVGSIVLRALLAHGFSPVLETTGSFAELRAKCTDYRAVGGTAEHASVAYDATSGRVLPLITRSRRGQARALRSRLLADERVAVAPGFRYVVGVFRVDPEGRTRPPSEMPLPRGIKVTARRDRSDLVAFGDRPHRSHLQWPLGTGSVPWLRSLDDVSRLLGHQPGNCPRCRIPLLRPESRLIIAALDGGLCDGTERLFRMLPPLVSFLGSAVSPPPWHRA